LSEQDHPDRWTIRDVPSAYPNTATIICRYVPVFLGVIHDAYAIEICRAHNATLSDASE
jgi:hypothetical protein